MADNNPYPDYQVSRGQIPQTDPSQWQTFGATPQQSNPPAYPDQINPDGSGGIGGFPAGGPGPLIPQGGQPQTAQASGSPDFSKIGYDTDLNPLAAQYGMTRDQLADARDQYWQPRIQQFRSQYGNGAAEDDMSVMQQMMGNAPLKGAGSSPSGMPGAQGGGTNLQNQLLQQMFDQQQKSMTEGKERSDNLYKMLMDRATQGTAIGKNDPNIRQQADAYSANATRASRNYLADLAESAGPYANLRGEQRSQNERLGQATGGFEAQLIGNEINAKRQEIQSALTQMGSQLSVEQQNALKQQLGILDNAIQQQGVGNDLLKTMLGNQQFYSNLGSQNDQFAATLGFNSANQASYWDAVRRGLL